MLEHPIPFDSISTSNDNVAVIKMNDERAMQESSSSHDCPAPAALVHGNLGGTQNDDHGTVASQDTSISRETNRTGRGYPTDRRRRDDGGSYISRSRSRSRDSRYLPRNASRSRDRHSSKSRDRFDRSSRSRDRYDGHHGERRYQRSESLFLPRRSFSNDGRNCSRRARSVSQGRFRPDFNRNASKSKSPGRFLKSVEREELEWPPCFDQDGSSFVFDSRSAMFYEAQSDFFYDPKSKLYYGNKKGAYFRFDETQNPPFVVVQQIQPVQVSPTEPMGPPLSLPQTTIGEPSPSPTKPLIAIKLKSKKAKKPNAQEAISTEAVAIAVSSKAQKEQVKNIEKWAEKRAELKVEVESVFTPSVASSLSTSTKTDDRLIIHPVKIKTTGKGEPICVVCKRKFPNIEKLRLHEKASELHKQNLAKLAEKESPKRKEAPELDYTDRAQKRRELHHDTPSVNFSSLHAVPEPSATDKLAPGDCFGKGNVGAKLLHQMGWGNGVGLGKNAGDASSDSSRTAETTNQSLKKDWERIEALANGSGGKSC